MTLWEYLDETLFIVSVQLSTTFILNTYDTIKVSINVKLLINKSNISSVWEASNWLLLLVKTGQDFLIQRNPRLGRSNAIFNLNVGTLALKSNMTVGSWRD